MSESCIELLNVNVTVNQARLLKDVNAAIPRGKITALIGPNGAGKTTLILAILGVIPYQGKILFFRDGKPQTQRPRIGYVPQRLDFDRGLPLTVLDFLIISSERRPLWLGYAKRAKDNAMKALDAAGIPHLSARKIGKLSGGELQRVVFAMALSREPEILLLDEPASGIDIAGETVLCEFMNHVENEGRLTVVIVSHDLSVITGHARHVICLNRSVQCQGGAIEVLTTENIMAVYGPHAGLYRHSESACLHGHGPGKH